MTVREHPGLMRALRLAHGEWVNHERLAPV